jgi:hypothetical protein
MPIMARHMGGGLDDPEAFAKTLETIRFFDREGHRAYFGTPENPGPIYQAAQHAINVYSDLGVLTFKLSPSDLVIHGVWRNSRTGARADRVASAGALC